MSTYFNPVPKPDGGKKSKKSKAPAKTVNTAAVEERRAQNNRNRNFGKAVERKVAELTGGDRVIASGAIKTSVWNLIGDVQVREEHGRRVIALIECKGTSGVTPKGDKTFVLKKSVLDQATKEGEQLGALAIVWLHWLNANYEQDDYWIIPAKQGLMMLDAVKQVHNAEIVNDSEEPPSGE